jgi:three-Cys-motif partner protein
MRDDDDPEKWGMKGQTEVKHRLLEKYLDPWLNKISTVSPEVHFLDGFAGRGEYTDGSKGSPLIAMDVADRKLREEGWINNRLSRFEVIAVEDNEQNYQNLKDCLDKKNSETDVRINAECYNKQFHDYASEYIETYRREPNACFVFIDPFGFSGVPLDTIQELINLRSTGIELFITFMSGKIAQFLTNETHQEAINEAFGTTEWRERIDENATKEERAEQLMLYYETRLRNEADISYVWPFQMYEESKRQTSYHLLHATNHFDGFELMKDIMWSEGARDTFAYLGPDHYPYEGNQKALASFNAGGSEEDGWIDDLADELADEYLGAQIKFEHLLRDQYPKTPFIAKHFRDACKLLADRNDASIHNFPKRKNGTPYGLGRDDEVYFKESQQSSISAFES